MKTRQKLSQGTKIEFLGQVAFIENDMGDKVEVVCEDVKQTWDWTMGGISCQVCK